MIKKRFIYVSALLALLLSSAVSAGNVYASAVDPGLALHWNLDEGSGTIANDDSGHGNDGTLYNGTVYMPGHAGTAVSLNGIDQYVQNDTPFTLLGTPDVPYALSAWVNIPAGVTQGNIVHISSDPSGGSWCIPFLRLENGLFKATGWDTNGAVSADDTTPVVPGQWYQVLTSWDATNGLRLFVNGNLVASTPQANYAASGGPMYTSIGLGNGNCSEDQGFLKGKVDDVRIYSRALTPTDIQSISTEGMPVTVATPALAPSVNTPVAELANTGVEIGLTTAIAALLTGSAVYARSRKYR